MKKVIAALSVLIVTGCAAFFPFGSALSTEELNERLIDYRAHITEEFLSGHLSVIAHDSLEGRNTGMRGQKVAAEYLSGFYNELGFTPMGDEGYYQYFGLNAEQTDSLVYTTFRVEEGDTVMVNRMRAVPGESPEFIRLAGSTAPWSGGVVFGGFGVNDSARGVTHLEGADLDGKWVLIFSDLPHIVDGDTLINPDVTNNNRVNYILNNTGANGLLVITDESQEAFSRRSEIASVLINNPRSMRLSYLDTSSRTAPFPKGYLQVSPQKAAAMLGLNSEEELDRLRGELIDEIREFRAADLNYLLEYRPYEESREIRSENVVAMLEGSDPELREEVVVLVAHYDHIGLTQPDETGDMINNGADDNGSGTVGLMAVANALSRAAEDGYRPKRSVLFLHVSAEEKGLLGSRYYSDHPVIPIEQTVASFNADMIGRSDPRNVEAGDTDYIYIIGGNIISSELDSLVHAANTRSVHMRLDYSYNDLQDPNQFYRRSDHWNFGRLEVPFVFFFTGVHEDYHRPSDQVDKIDFPKLTRTAGLVYSSTVMVANYDGRPVVDNQDFIDITRDRPR